MFQDSFEGGRQEPGWWEDVGSSLALEEECEPERQGSAVWWAEGGSRALGRKC